MREYLETKVIAEKGPYRVIAYLVHDQDTTPLDTDIWFAEDSDHRAGWDREPYDDFSAKVLDDWRNGLWNYVGIVVEIVAHGIVIGTDSLWGIENGCPYQGESGATEYTDPLADTSPTGMLGDIVNEAISQAEATLKGLHDLQVKELKELAL